MLVKPFIPKRARIEMIPLIDMFFLLLIFFIFSVFWMTMQQGLMVDLPRAATAASTGEEAVTISVSAEGALFFNGTPMTLEALPGALRAAQAQQPPRLVTLSADQQTPHGVVVSVLDAVRQAGFSRVSIQAEPVSELRR
jgi:biopolymer transport protein ExbD